MSDTWHELRFLVLGTSFFPVLCFCLPLDHSIKEFWIRTRRATYWWATSNKQQCIWPIIEMLVNVLLVLLLVLGVSWFYQPHLFTPLNYICSSPGGIDFKPSKANHFEKQTHVRGIACNVCIPILLDAPVQMWPVADTPALSQGYRDD